MAQWSVVQEGSLSASPSRFDGEALCLTGFQGAKESRAVKAPWSIARIRFPNYPILMLKVGDRLEILLLHRMGNSIRSISRITRHDRKSVRDVLREPAPQPRELCTREAVVPAEQHEKVFRTNAEKLFGVKCGVAAQAQAAQTPAK
jgi:hypothetical protein